MGWSATTPSQSPGNEASDVGTAPSPIVLGMRLVTWGGCTPPPMVLGMRLEKWGPEWTMDHSQEVLMAGAANVHGYLDY